MTDAVTYLRNLVAATAHCADTDQTNIGIGRLRGALAEIDCLRAALQHESDCVEAAKGEVEALRAALEHMQWCQSCAEGSWEDCEGGRDALAALAQAKEGA